MHLLAHQASSKSGVDIERHCVWHETMQLFPLLRILKEVSWYTDHLIAFRLLEKGASGYNVRSFTRWGQGHQTWYAKWWRLSLAGTQVNEGHFYIELLDYYALMLYLGFLVLIPNIVAKMWPKVPLLGPLQSQGSGPAQQFYSEEGELRGVGKRAIFAKSLFWSLACVLIGRGGKKVNSHIKT